MKGTNGLLTLGVLVLGSTSAAAFFIKWPWAFPNTAAGTTATAVGAAQINYGFLRPAVIVPIRTTTVAATTTTTTRPTTPLSQLLINALLGTNINLPTNNSLLIALAAAAAGGNRPIIGGIAQPYPSVIGGGGLIPGGGIGGVAAPIQGGVASGGGGGFGGGGGILIPNGFPASGGLLASGLLPGYFPGGVLGRSAHAGGGGNPQNGSSGGNNGKVIFASSK